MPVERGQIGLQVPGERAGGLDPLVAGELELPGQGGVFREEGERPAAPGLLRDELAEPFLRRSTSQPALEPGDVQLQDDGVPEQARQTLQERRKQQPFDGRHGRAQGRPQPTPRRVDQGCHDLHVAWIGIGRRCCCGVRCRDPLLPLGRLVEEPGQAGGIEAEQGGELGLVELVAGEVAVEQVVGDVPALGSPPFQAQGGASGVDRQAGPPPVRSQPAPQQVAPLDEGERAQPAGTGHGGRVRQCRCRNRRTGR